MVLSNLIWTGGVFFTPDPGFTGADTIVYLADYGNGKQDEAIYTITVEAEVFF